MEAFARSVVGRLMGDGEDFLSECARFFPSEVVDEKATENREATRKQIERAKDAEEVYTRKVQAGVKAWEQRVAGLRLLVREPGAPRPGRRAHSTVDGDVARFLQLGLDKWLPVTDSAGHFLGNWPRRGDEYLVYHAVADLLAGKPAGNVPTYAGEVPCTCGIGPRGLEQLAPDVFLFSTMHSSFAKKDWSSSSLNCNPRACP